MWLYCKSADVSLQVVTGMSYFLCKNSGIHHAHCPNPGEFCPKSTVKAAFEKKEEKKSAEVKSDEEERKKEFEDEVKERKEELRNKLKEGMAQNNNKNNKNKDKDEEIAGINRIIVKNDSQIVEIKDRLEKIRLEINSYQVKRDSVNSQIEELNKTIEELISKYHFVTIEEVRDSYISVYSLYLPLVILVI